MKDEDARIEEVRKFNRFYTRQIGVLQEQMYESPLSLAEVRVLYELAHRDDSTAKEIGEDLGLDAGYMSRILRGFEKNRWIVRKASKSDGRQRLLSLTSAGKKAFAPINVRSQEEIKALLKPVSIPDQQKLVAAMTSIEEILGGETKEKVSYILRPPAPGDMGWIAHRHGVLYSREYGYDDGFEALVAEIVAKFVKNFDAKRERCWIAERNGEVAGSVFVVKKTKTVAKLRCLLVEPSARGLGIGKRLVEECIRFAKQAGYKKMTLWTHAHLSAARRIYEEAGFQCVKRQHNPSFGVDLTDEVWDLDF